MSKTFIIVFLSFLLLLLFNCKGKQTLQQDEASLDSLQNRCFELLNQLQTDTLRMAAEEYMKVAEPYSKRYYKARQFYINSYFNAKDYDRVLSMLEETGRMPRFKEYPVTVCDYMYTRARSLQYSKRYPEAVEAFKACIATDSEDKQVAEDIQRPIINSMTQLMNTCIASGNSEEGYRYFRNLKDKPTKAIHEFSMRDLYTHLSYSAFHAGHTDEAYGLTDSIFLITLHDPTPEKLFRDYYYAAIIFSNNPEAKEKVIFWLQQAIQEAEKYDYVAGIEWCTDFLASLYWGLNRVEEGTELYYRSLRMARKRGDLVSQCNIYTSLCSRYNDWGLYEQANTFADQAVNVIKDTEDDRFKGFAYRSKAEVMKSWAKPDSALYYYKKAEEHFAKSGQPVIKRLVQEDIAVLLIDYHSGDSLSAGIKLIRKVLNSAGKDETRGYEFFILGKGLIKQGYPKEGEAMLDSMYKDSMRVPEVQYKDGVLEFVIDYYLARKDYSKAAQYTALYRKQIGTRLDENISRKVTSAMIQYQTEKKEQQLKLVTAELSIKELRIQLYIAAVIVLLLMLIVGVLWYVHKRKLHRNRQKLAEQEKLIAQHERELIEARMHEQEQQLTNAIYNLRDANHRSEQMREQLDEFLSDIENRQRLASVTPSLFREEGEVKFRKYFTQLHPCFLHNLKEQIPGVSRSEEILCMLMALDQNQDQIADIMCIEKKSVKMARYRIRKKMNLEQDESLDSIIKAVL